MIGVLLVWCTMWLAIFSLLAADCMLDKGDNINNRFWQRVVTIVAFIPFINIPVALVVALVQVTVVLIEQHNTKVQHG